jgi:hypothetical protein
MGNLLYVIALILIITWAIGFIVFNTGGFIHVLLAIALIVIIFRLIQNKKSPVKSSR